MPFWSSLLTCVGIATPYDGSIASSSLRPGSQLGASMHQVYFLSPLHPALRFDIHSLRRGIAICYPSNRVGIAPTVRTVVVTLLSEYAPRPSPSTVDLVETGRTQLWGA